MNKKTLRQDNAGMSLLELVVAVSIFMVLALLLFRGFVSSSRLNKKSGIYLSATTTAQNIMEEIKAKTFAQTALAFNYPKIVLAFCRMRPIFLRRKILVMRRKMIIQMAARLL